MRFREKDQPSRDGYDEDSGPPRVVGLRDRIAHFTWSACTMSTGAVAIVLANAPNTFTGLRTIGKIFYILNVILFCLFSCLIAIRFVLVPAKLSASIHHPVEGLFHGAYWVSVSLILNGAQAYGVPDTGPWLVKALEVCFWIYCAVVFIVGVAQYFVFFQGERLSVRDAVPAWIFPIYPLLVVGCMAGTMVPSQTGPRGWYMFVGAVTLQGLGWVVALMMYSLYTQRLMTSALPSPSSRPGMYVSVGPAGYTAAGLISLAKQAPSIVPPDQFTNLEIADGEIIKIVGILSGLFIVLFAFWFFCISTIAVIAGARHMTFTLNWWAFIFPNAGLILATIQVGSVLTSEAINGVCSALTILLVIAWLGVAFCCVRALWRGQVMWPGKDEDKDMHEVGWGRCGVL
ncbi:hypothetical protein K458DRAFT_365518 [Lentithecium fluviatile CBS 122367]|uniref:Malic acid transport protein n=1 Tax=Lentithecium fluviatile CBS 122367 TaxID=1168545 RepID=A0A6G1J4V0_9PLEO|nr:hypothetical protein K458DRAFT_365518 [Lentithecium fluviatile CBS 122367]